MVCAEDPSAVLVIVVLHSLCVLSGVGEEGPADGSVYDGDDVGAGRSKVMTGGVDSTVEGCCTLLLQLVVAPSLSLSLLSV